MAKINAEICVKHIHIIPFIAEFKSVSDVSVLKVFGIPVYRRAGNAKKLFFLSWGEQ